MQCFACRRILARVYRSSLGKEQRQERDRKGNLFRKFKITIEEYNRLLVKQQGVCAICRQPETDIHHLTGMPQSLAVDHDSTTGRVRGLLCAKCNKGIGSLRHSPSILISAIRYLEGIETAEGARVTISSQQLPLQD